MILYWSLEAAELLPIMVLRVEIWGKKKKEWKFGWGMGPSVMLLEAYTERTLF